MGRSHFAMLVVPFFLCRFCFVITYCEMDLVYRTTVFQNHEAKVNEQKSNGNEFIFVFCHFLYTFLCVCEQSYFYDSLPSHPSCCASV